jgi:hypothetical protein
MKKFGIFEMVSDKHGLTITFNAVLNPVKKTEILILKEEDIETAVNKASDILKTFGAETHSLYGDYDTVGLFPFPNYFVGEIKEKTADNFDTPSLAFRIHDFSPVKK